MLLVVEPRILRDALEAMLLEVGLDDVIVCSAGDPNRTAAGFDTAILSAPDLDVTADVVLVLPGPDTAHGGLVSTRAGTQEVPLGTPGQILAALDARCPSVSLRAVPVTPGGRS